MSARQQQPTEVDERIARFLGRHHVLTLATAADGTPYCANAFYAYDKGRNRLVFTSDLSTRHALAELTLWALVPDYLKFTDNTLGFGKKLIWKA